MYNRNSMRTHKAPFIILTVYLILFYVGAGVHLPGARVVTNEQINKGPLTTSDNLQLNYCIDMPQGRAIGSPFLINGYNTCNPRQDKLNWTALYFDVAILVVVTSLPYLTRKLKQS